ncbi:hypothetical protein H6G81_05790 [Scytonema hofmannii FACHB-248]|uniref:Uncharacterized protein n=1 Tax=Scytonema hofmannii FACHB-248 TaxID=1842502 RepID=A0ABR8GKZ4_9CYAN|nr:MULTISPECIES: hypothetical protein [Nostocales]MBD2604050.1 hypothetical protein [Scytonema hofmannii FACHB-248]
MKKTALKSDRRFYDILLAVMLSGSDPQVMAPLLEINSSQVNEHFAQLLKELPGLKHF